VASCPERARLLRKYESAVGAFGNAVTTNKGRLTQKALESWQNALKAIIDHEREHGCGKRVVRPTPPVS
jgi:hypothetical protein